MYRLRGLARPAAFSLLATAVALLLALSVGAQPYPGDLIQVTPSRVPPPHTYGGLYHVDPQGRLTTIKLGSSYYDLTMDGANRDLVVGTPTGVSVIRPLTGQTVQTLWQGPPLNTVETLTPIHTGEFVVAGTDWSTGILVFRMSADGRQLATIRTLPMNPNWHTYRQDLVTGQVVEGGPSGFTLVPPGGGPVTTLYGGNVFFFTQDHVDGSFLFTDTAGLFRFDRVKGLTTLGTGSWYYEPVVDRSPGRGEIVTGWMGSLLRLDRQGTAITTYPGAYAGVRIAFLEGRNLATRRVSPGPNQWAFDLHFPSEAGRAFALGLSLSGFAPGVALGSRTISLVPDDLLRLSITGGLGPLLQGNLGRLDSAGRATAQLDAGPFGPAVSGLRIWAAAVTLDAAAPHGIATVSKPVILVLD
jgi:hypothetical protein